MTPAIPHPALAPVPALQASATGGSVVIAVLVLLGLAVAAGLSLLIAYEALKGYRGTHDRAMLLLAVGIVLLTGGPIALRIALPTLTDTPESVRLLSTTVSELLGLGCILYAIYGRP
ncbi:hypothetical protein I7X12_02490 [Halosimplex litoreum]|uniref:Uncharacterized protein n=1 Tax=Halosimplex litoreum TaxID=1198301 RepID=A0A7T3KVZ8_9EURY|nr:hypothetical protein [Halosimplex litoreum]QPV63523.1 hypothetical protein I7X12_02490 [Halosimplex litoreum]